MKFVFKVPRSRRTIVFEGTHGERMRLRSKLKYPNYVFSAACDGYRLAYGGRGGKIIEAALNSLEHPQKLRERNAHEGSVMDLLRLEERLFSCSRDAKIRCRLNGRLLFELLGHDACVRSIAIRGDYLVSVSMDGRTLLRDRKQKKLLCELSKHRARVVHVRNHENIFVDVTIDGLVRLYDVEAREKLWTYELGVAAMGVSINRPYAAVSTIVGVHVFDLKKQELVKTIPVPTSDGKIRRLSRIREAIGVGGDFLYVIDDPLGDAHIHLLRGHTDRIYNVVFHEGLAFTCSLDRSLGIWTDELLWKEERVEETVKEMFLMCSSLGSEEAPEWLVEAFKARPVRALRYACGRCLEDLVEKLKRLSLIECRGDECIVKVPPEDPKSLKG